MGKYTDTDKKAAEEGTGDLVRKAWKKEVQT